MVSSFLEKLFDVLVRSQINQYTFILDIEKVLLKNSSSQVFCQGLDSILKFVVTLALHC